MEILQSCLAFSVMVNSSTVLVTARTAATQVAVEVGTKLGAHKVQSHGIQTGASKRQAVGDGHEDFPEVRVRVFQMQVE